MVAGITRGAIHTTHNIHTMRHFNAYCTVSVISAAAIQEDVQRLHGAQTASMLDVLHKEEGTSIEINLFGELQGKIISLVEG
jgi:hypothetical protein